MPGNTTESAPVHRFSTDDAVEMLCRHVRDCMCEESLARLVSELIKDGIVYVYSGEDGLESRPYCDGKRMQVRYVVED